MRPVILGLPAPGRFTKRTIHKAPANLSANQSVRVIHLVKRYARTFKNVPRLFVFLIACWTRARRTG